MGVLFEQEVIDEGANQKPFVIVLDKYKSSLRGIKKWYLMFLLIFILMMNHYKLNTMKYVIFVD